MVKFLPILFVMTALVFVLCAAEAPRLRSVRQQKQKLLQLQQRHRFFARQVLAEEEQEEAVAAVTPYPAAGIKPEVPFDLPTEVEEEQSAEQEPEQEPEQESEQQPDNTYLPPDNTYGPPPVDAVADDAEEDINPVVADAEEDDAEVGSTPEQQPAIVNDAENEIDENADILPSVNSESSRLVFGRRLRPRKSAKLVSSSSSSRQVRRGRRLMRF